MNEQSYLQAQERITILAFDALASCHAAKSPQEKLEYYGVYHALCLGAARLRNAYQRTLQKKEQQHVGFTN